MNNKIYTTTVFMMIVLLVEYLQTNLFVSSKNSGEISIHLFHRASDNLKV